MTTRKARSKATPVLKRSATRAKKAPPSSPSPAVEPISSHVVDATTKLTAVINLLSRAEGATIPQMVELTGWKARSVRGFMAGALKAKRGIEITSTKADGVRTYRIRAETP